MQIKSNKKGFTLLELLIVISIIAILSVILIIVLDPSETLKKSRDVQRISDLNTMKTALGIFTTSTSTPYLASPTSNAACKTGTGAGTYPANSKIWYSFPTDSGVIYQTGTLDGQALGNSPTSSQATLASSTLTNGYGWVPVNFDGLIPGSPIASEPLDPTNTVGTLTAVKSSDLTYRYACNASSTTWEIDAVLESNAYTVADNKMAKDGGNNNNYYEVGTNLKILGTGTDF